MIGLSRKHLHEQGSYFRSQLKAQSILERRSSFQESEGADYVNIHHQEV